jgi:hypothetical protein
MLYYKSTTTALSRSEGASAVLQSELSPYAIS